MRSRAATTPPGPAIKIKSAASATVPFAAATLLSVTRADSRPRRTPLSPPWPGRAGFPNFRRSSHR